MAEIDTNMLASEIASVRHDVGIVDGNLRDTLGHHAAAISKGVSDNGYRIGDATAQIRSDIGREACGINQNVANTRSELEKGFADTRYNIATEACGINRSIGDVRQEEAENFGHTRRDIQSAASDIRREAAEHGNAIRQTVMQEGQENMGFIKDLRYDLAARLGDAVDRLQAHSEHGFDRTVDRIESSKDYLADKFFTVGRDLMDLRQGQATLAKDVELNALKTQLDAKENTRYLSDRITADGEKTRGLINDLKYHDLNRGLVERQTELVNCEQERRHYRDRHDDARWAQVQSQYGAQWAQLQSQVQAFQSQLQETRQGMVNFGTMAGVGQSSTSNNVR